MNQTPPFDAYHELLGIAPSEQPPTLYRLLGVTPFESAATVIERAADRQMAHLRTFQIGKHQADSQRLLHEVARARQVLLNDQDRADYDAKLKEQMKPSAAAKPLKVAQALPTPATVAKPLPAEPSPVVPVASQPLQLGTASNPLSFPVQSAARVKGGMTQSSKSLLIAGAAAAALIATTGIGLLIAISGGNPPQEANAVRPESQTDPQPSVHPPELPGPPIPKPSPPAVPTQPKPMPVLPPTPVPATPETPVPSTPPEIPIAPPPPLVENPSVPQNPTPNPIPAADDFAKERAEVVAARAELRSLPKFKTYYEYLEANPDKLPINGPKLAAMLHTEAASNAAIRAHAPSHLAALQEVERLATAGPDYVLAATAIDAQVNHAIPLLSAGEARAAKGKLFDAAADAANKQKVKQPEREALLGVVRALLLETVQARDTSTLTALLSADAKLCWTEADRLAAIQFLLPSAEQLVVQENVELASPLLNHLDAQLLKSPVGKPRKEALDAITTLRGRQTLIATTEQARKTLAKTPTDPAANQTLGIYLLMQRGAWRESLSHFALGSEAEWRTLAADSLKAQMAAEKVALADRWSATSAEPNAPGKEIARKLFEEALTDSSLVGIARAAAQEKVKALGSSTVKAAPVVATSADSAEVAKPSVTPDSLPAAGKALTPNKWTELLPQVDLNHDVEAGYWLRGPDKSIRCESVLGSRLRMPVILKNCSYDLSVDFRIGSDHDNINLVIPVGDSHVEVVISNTVNYFTSIKGVRSSQNEAAVKKDLVGPNRQHSYEVSVRLSGAQAKVEVAINGIKQFDYEGPYSDFGVPPTGPGGLQLATKVQPYLYTNETAVEYLSVQVRPRDRNAVQGRAAPVLEPLPPSIDAMKRTPLVNLTPTSVQCYKDTFAVNKGTRPPIINAEDCPEFLFAHAASSVKYNIPPKSKYFTAIAYCATSESVKFIVRVDGQEMFISQGLPMSRVLVELPEGAKELELACDPLGNIKFDQSCWCFPAFR